MSNSEGFIVQHGDSSYYYCTLYLKSIMGKHIECSHAPYQATDMLIIFTVLNFILSTCINHIAKPGYIQFSFINHNLIKLLERRKKSISSRILQSNQRKYNMK